MKFEVPRESWRCGGKHTSSRRGAGVTQLLNSWGFRCCLGHVAQQLGVPDDQLQGFEYPQQVEGLRPSILCYCGANSSLAADAMTINDRTSCPQHVREEALVELFKRHGHTLTFTGQFVTSDPV